MLVYAKARVGTASQAKTQLAVSATSTSFFEAVPSVAAVREAGCRHSGGRGGGLEGGGTCPPSSPFGAINELHDAAWSYETMGGSHGHEAKMRAIHDAVRAKLQQQPDPLAEVHFCEVGFNAGYSAVVALEAGPARVRATSFDIVENGVVHVAKAFVDGRYPRRHALVWGASDVMLVSARELLLPCDVVFVDGGHEEGVAEADLRNFAHLARSGATLIADDTLCGDARRGACDGPAVAWARLVGEGYILQTGPCSNAGFCTGVYSAAALEAAG